MCVPVITLDGPSGVGKGTVAKKLAEILDGWDYLDSGAIYRSVALVCHEEGITHWSTIAKRARSLDLRFEGDQVIINGVDRTSEIRTEKMGIMTSKIAKFLAVREAIKPFQLAARKGKGLVADGRDMGEIFSGSNAYRFFLTASAQVRAMRRWEQLKSVGRGVSFSKVLSDLKTRDTSDRKRRWSPLISKGKITINTDNRIPEEVVTTIMMTCREKGLVAA